MRKAAASSSSGASSPSSMTPRHKGIARLDRLVDAPPGCVVRLPLQLPPVRLDAELVEPREHARDRVVLDRAVSCWR